MSPLPPPGTINYDPYYEGLTSLEMVSLVRRRLGVMPTDETRYAKADVIQALNQGAIRFVKLTGCLIHPAVIVCQANKMTYRVPFGTLRVWAGRYYTGPGRTDYWELNIIRDMRMMQRQDSEFRGNPGDPEWLFPAYRGGNVLTIGVSPYPSADGSPWVASDYGVLATATGYQTAGLIQGFQSFAYPNSAAMVDGQGQDLVALGALVGYPIYNATQGTSGIITAIGNAAATNDMITAAMSGSGLWQVNDVYAIPMGEFGTVASGDTEFYTIAGGMFGTIGDIAGGSGNLVLDCVRRPLPLSVNLDDAISEVPAAYHEAVLAYAVYWLGAGMFGGLVQNSKALASLAIFNNYVAEYNSTEDLVEVSENSVEASDWWQ